MFTLLHNIYTRKGIDMRISAFVKEKRNTANLTQPELAEKAGVGLRFVRDLEQGKESLRLDKVNQVLKLFGYQVGAVPINRQELLDQVAESAT
ncbi:transcriptional regulator [Flammeovirgaceae bacterium 311]|nr:transcriptional regulator [Flammeovirgaceae bacterium 311]